MKSNLVSYVELSVAMVIVGSTVVVGKLVTLSFPVFLASALRFALSSIILLPELLKAGNGFPRLSRKLFIYDLLALRAEMDQCY